MATEVSTNTLQQAAPTDTLQPPAALPPLDNGDRLTRSEFERRYDAMPHLKKAELIEGVVYMPSPVRVRSHGKPHGQIMGWVGVYCAATPGVDFADNATLRLDPDKRGGVEMEALNDCEVGKVRMIHEGKVYRRWEKDVGGV